MLFSSAAVMYIYRIAKLNYSRLVSITASLLFTFSNLNIIHAHNTRVYSLFVLLAAASMYYYLGLIKAPKKKPYITGLVISNILLAYSHFFGFFIIFLQIFYTLAIPIVRKEIFKPHLRATILFTGSYAPYIYIFITRFIKSAGNGTWVAPPWWKDYFHRLWMFSNGPENYKLFLVVLTVGFIFYIIRYKKIKYFDFMIIGWFVIPYTFMFLISYKIPMFLDNYLIYITPAFYLSIGIAIYYMGKYKEWIGIAVAVLCVDRMYTHAHLDYNAQRFPSRVAQHIEELKQPNTPVYISPPWVKLNIAYYLNRDAFRDFTNFEMRLKESQVYPVYNSTEMDTSILQNSSNAILIDGWMELTDPKGTIKNTLSARFDSIHQTNYNGYKLLHYTHPKLKDEME